MKMFAIRPVRTGITLSTLHKNFGFINPPRIYGDEPTETAEMIGKDSSAQYAHGDAPIVFPFEAVICVICPVRTGMSQGKRGGFDDYPESAPYTRG